MRKLLCVCFLVTISILMAFVQKQELILKVPSEKNNPAQQKQNERKYVMLLNFLMNTWHVPPFWDEYLFGETVE